MYLKDGFGTYSAKFIHKRFSKCFQLVYLYFICRLYTQTKTWECTWECMLNRELGKIHGWLCTNKFSINLTKPNLMVFNKTNECVYHWFINTLTIDVKYVETHTQQIIYVYI